MYITKEVINLTSHFLPVGNRNLASFILVNNTPFGDRKQSSRIAKKNGGLQNQWDNIEF